MNASTTELLEKLQQTSDLSAFFETYRGELISQTAGGFIAAVMERERMSSSELAGASGLGNYTYRILNDERNASRNALLSVAFGLRLSVPEAQMLLRIGRHAMLDPRFHRDAALIFALSSGYAVPACNDLLDDIGEQTL